MNSRRDLGRSSSLDRQQPQRHRSRRGRRSPAAQVARALVVLSVTAGVIYLSGRQTDGVVDPVLSQSSARGEPPTPITTATAVSESVETGDSLEAAIAEDRQLVPVSSEVRFGPASPFERVAARLSSGQTLVQALVEGGVPREEANRIVYALKSHVDFRRLRPGDRFEGVLWLGDSLINGTFYHGRLDRYRVARDGDGLVASADPIALATREQPVRGTVASSLFEAIYAAGERPALIMSFIDLFSWDFDFNVSTRAGDRFEMLVEKRYIEEAFYDYGSIIAGRYTSAGQSYEACWYEPEDKTSEWAGYYHLDGSSVKGAFLRSPVKFSRISSRFTLSRFHPVLKIRRPHRGVDYAAPMGTPVYAVSNGLVIDARWMGGAGKAVRIKHPNGWITSYSHLSRISVRKGQRVKQGQLVGKVGSTGHSTGPHLDYRVKINGKFVDPLRLRYPRGKSVPKGDMATFRAQCSQKLARLDDEVDVAALE